MSVNSYFQNLFQTSSLCLHSSLILAPTLRGKKPQNFWTFFSSAFYPVSLAISSQEWSSQNKSDKIKVTSLFKMLTSKHSWKIQIFKKGLQMCTLPPALIPHHPHPLSVYFSHIFLLSFLQTHRVHSHFRGFVLTSASAWDTRLWFQPDFNL